MGSHPDSIAPSTAKRGSADSVHRMATTSKTKTSKATTPRDVVLSYFDALGRREIDDAVKHLDSEVIEDITSVGVLRGREEVRKFFDGLMKAAPDMQLIVDRTIAEDDLVAIQWRMSGTFNGGPLFNGVQPTGGHLELRGFDVIEVRDGLIVRNDAFQDGLELARSLGMMPPQDSAAERAMIGAFNAATKVRQALRDRFSG
jgi:predicted ester cyclase